MLPVIGVTTYGRHEHDLVSTHYDSLYYLPADYAEAVRSAGGIPVYLPPGDNLFPGVLERLDGILFSGGTDLDPALYGGDHDHPELGRLDAQRDAAELAGLTAALQRPDLPILCICRGLQALNVALGGSLSEHLPDLGRGDMHRDENGHWTRHPATLVPGSRLAEIMDVAAPVGVSGHHQVVRELAPELDITARATDGLIEALEHATHPWCVAVQWHPEITAHEDPAQQRLFDAFVETARQSMAARHD